MKFKDYADYKSQRDALIKEAEGLLAEGKTTEFEAKTKEVEQMDTAYADFAQKQADLAALSGAVKAPLSNLGATGAVDRLNQDDDITYRKSFMNYVLTGKGAPVMTNADANTTTSDVGAVIPNTILNKIIEKIEKAGNILARVTQTYYKGGVSVPTSSAKPTASWTTESGTTDKQKKATGSITFSYYKLKVQVSMSVIVENVTLDIFEKTIASNIAEAIIKALETAIISGSGTGQPKGILTETVITGQEVPLVEGASITYVNLCEAEGKLPAGYDSAVWCMRKATYMSQIVGMVDTAGQPIARVNAGTNGKPEYTILGRPVEFSDDVPAFATTVTADTTVAFLFRFEDYMLNTSLGVTVSTYVDQNTDDKITKAITLADGKVIDKNSLVKVTIKNS